jgi:hypothetical protein
LKKLCVTLIACLPLMAVLAACVPAPKRAYTPEETSKLDDLPEVMRINAATMDPLFSYEEPTKFDADKTFGTLPGAAAQMKAAGTALQNPRISGGFPAEFVEQAKDLVVGADKLADAHKRNDRAAASLAIKEIHQTCRDCHSQFR